MSQIKADIQIYEYVQPWIRGSSARPYCPHKDDPTKYCHIGLHDSIINPLTAGAAYIGVFAFY